MKQTESSREGRWIFLTDEKRLSSDIPEKKENIQEKDCRDLVNKDMALEGGKEREMRLYK